MSFAVNKKEPVLLSNTKGAVDFLFRKLGPSVKLATPLGLGKPNRLLNEIYDRVAKDPSLRLSIHTALSLAPPQFSEELAQRFFAPFQKRHWGEDYPNLKYAQAAVQDKLPANIRVHEFYFQAGSALHSSTLQRNYQSVNYTHVAENILRDQINVIVALIAKSSGPGGPRYSLSCNPDVTLDVADLYAENGTPLTLIGVVHPDLPFLAGEAEVPASFFDAIVDSPENRHELFGLPRMPMSPEDHLIGFFSSLLVKDGGTLQVGIGSLSDAIVASLRVRQQNNALYLKLLEKYRSHLSRQLGVENPLHDESFIEGLYGLTEMLTDGFMHLRKMGILKRFVNDEDSGLKTYVHGSFILGSKEFYGWLRELSPEDANGLRMTRVSKVNDLYDPKETLLRRQRVHGRFFNTTMQMSLLGEAASETLPDAKVVSGVGGQYNFVAMANELKGAKSVLMLRSVRLEKDGRRVSNIVWAPGHITIPRHSRDLVVTEYGIAELKGKSDEECIKALLDITDSQFQADLLAQAKRAGKISRNYEIPDEFRRNTSENIAALTRDFKNEETFNPFPFGSDFTPEEEKILLALQKLQDDQKRSTVKLLFGLFKESGDPGKYGKELERMGLLHPRSLKERIYRRLLLRYLTLGS
jgi:acyl-CoA hydrolase